MLSEALIAPASKFRALARTSLWPRLWSVGAFGAWALVGEVDAEVRGVTVLWPDARERADEADEDAVEGYRLRMSLVGERSTVCDWRRG